MGEKVGSLEDLSRYQTSDLSRVLTKVGRTPLLPVDVAPRPGQRLALKLEGCNPGGSAKDRVALRILGELADSGVIGPGDTIVDSTSGNFGVSMAWICRALGYAFHAVTDPKASQRNVEYMRALGATVQIVTEPDETGGYLRTRLRRSRQILAEGGAAGWSDQYSSPANPASHFATTGPELHAAYPVPPDAVFVAASTGGTLAGISRYLRPRWRNCRFVAVDGHGSVLFGGRPGPRAINGLGSSHASSFLTPADYDEVMTVDGDAAVSWCRRLAADHGVWVGGSSGAVVSAAVSWLTTRAPETTVACLCPDHGEIYLDTIFAGGMRTAEASAKP